MIQTNKKVVRRLFLEGFSRNDANVLREVLHPEFTLTSAGAVAKDSADRNGSMDTLIDGMHHNHRSFEGWSFTIDHLMAENDHVSVRWTATGRHVGSFMGEAPTGREVTLQGNSLYEMRDGQILRDWVFANQRDFLIALGVGAPPEPEAGAALVRRFWTDIIDAHSIDPVNEIISPDYRQHADGIAQGPDGLKAFLTDTFTASRGMRAEIHDIVSTGEIVVSRTTVQFETPPPGWDPSQTIIDIFRTDGRHLTEHWDTR
ncbi:ester cyclase [Aestuariibius insulae]|uniref:ester cyclase n=1 Tax=Aestuariibius insulae TaxID=2058287 RepID=UPI00345E116A